jgi:epi-isozizaene 5-monooxygenase / beta-farnesene synthase
VQDTSLGPYRIPKGTTTLISLWGLSHNPDTWPDPWRFDPSRWLGPEAKDRSPYASIPFSLGPRGCLGRQLSIMEQRTILVHTVRRYHLRLHSRSKPRFTTPVRALRCGRPALLG